MSVKITKHFFKYNALKYFRTNAHLIELGTFGEKKDPIGAKAYLNPTGKIKASHLCDRKIKQSPPLSINWSSVKKSELEAGVNLNFLGLGRKHSMSLDYKKAKSANLQLLNFSLSEGTLKRILNNDANIVRNAMADEGRDARVVSEVWVVVEAELAEHISTSTDSSHEWKALGNSIEFTARSSRHGTHTISIGEGTTFAYKMHRVSDWSKGKKQVEELDVDYKGFG